MNKKILVVAVAGAIGAPGLALAQAANVNIYGHFDGRLDSMKFSANTAGTIAGQTKQHVTFGAPRWGLRGSESLGGGMTAYFQVESGMSPDGRPAFSDASGIYSLGGRDSYLGLRSNWGQVQIGGFGSAYKDVASTWNASMFGHGGIIMGNGDTTGASPSPVCTGLVTPGGVGVAAFPTAASPSCQPQIEGNGTSFSRRVSNYVEYASPVFSGFRGKIGTDLGEKDEPSIHPTNPTGALGQSKPRLRAYALTWSGGPWSAAVGYETHSGFRATQVAGTQRMAKDTGWTVGGKWNFGAGEVGIGWERLKYGNQAAAGAENDFQLTNWVVNGNWKVTSAGTLHAGYSKTPGMKSCGTALALAGTCGSPTAATHVHVGYDHALSKRTALYGIYSKINNGAAATYYYIAGPTSNSGGGGTGGLSAGVDVTTLGVGVKHNF